MAARAGGHGEPPRFPVATPTGIRGGHRLSVPASGESAVSTAGLRAAGFGAARFPARCAVGAPRTVRVDQRDAACARAATACGRLARPHRVASPGRAAAPAGTPIRPATGSTAWGASRPATGTPIRPASRPRVVASGTFRASIGRRSTTGMAGSAACCACG